MPSGGDPWVAGCAARWSGICRVTPPSEEELFVMRRAAWRKQGIVVINPADVRDAIIRQALINEAIRLYGQRECA
jgi:hypothetical protein